MSQERQPVSEQQGLCVDWKRMPTAEGRERKKKKKTGDTELSITATKSKTRRET